MIYILKWILIGSRKFLHIYVLQWSEVQRCLVELRHTCVISRWDRSSGAAWTSWEEVCAHMTCTKDELLLGSTFAACSAGWICCAVLNSSGRVPRDVLWAEVGRRSGEQLPWARPTGWIPLLKMSENGVLSPGVQDLIIHHALAYRLILVYDSLLSLKMAYSAKLAHEFSYGAG